MKCSVEAHIAFNNSYSRKYKDKTDKQIKIITAYPSLVDFLLKHSSAPPFNQLYFQWNLSSDLNGSYLLMEKYCIVWQDIVFIISHSSLYYFVNMEDIRIFIFSLTYTINNHLKGKIKQLQIGFCKKKKNCKTIHFIFINTYINCSR